MPVPISPDGHGGELHRGAEALAATKRYPLVLMLEPLYRCNLACAGCGKIQYPHARAEAAAVRRGLPARGRRVRRADGVDPGRRAADAPRDRRDRRTGSSRGRSTSTSAPTRLLLEEKLDLFTPSKYLTFSVHLDGLRERHDARSVGEGIFDEGVPRDPRGARARLPRHHEHDALRRTDPEHRAVLRLPERRARRRGHDGLARPTPTRRRPTRSTSCRRAAPRSSSPRSSRAAGAEALALQPVAALPRVPRGQGATSTARRGAIPSYSIFGWQKPCYLIQDGYAESFRELLETTDVGELRAAERQPAVRELHGALRLRADRGARDDALAAAIAARLRGLDLTASSRARREAAGGGLRRMARRSSFRVRGAVHEVSPCERSF